MGIDPTLKRNAQTRLKRIAGQVGGIERMLEDGRDGLDVVRQVTAVQAALMETGRLLLAAHVEESLASALESQDPARRRERIDALSGLLLRFGRPEDLT